MTSLSDSKILIKIFTSGRMYLNVRLLQVQGRQIFNCDDCKEKCKRKGVILSKGVGIVK